MVSSVVDGTPTLFVSNWCCARRAAQTEATKTLRDAGHLPLVKSRDLAKQSAETPPNVLARWRMKSTRMKVGTEEKQQPCRLQVLNRKNTLKQDSVGCNLGSQLGLDTRSTPQRSHVST